MRSEEQEERRCPVCNCQMREVSGEGYDECRRCRTRARFAGEELLALYIPDYHLRLEELRRRNEELVSLIEAESSKGQERNMREIRSMHEERQRVLSEYSFLGYFQQFVDEW